MNQFNKIKYLEIKNLFDQKNIKWKFSDVNVLVGKNGSGKSTILNILRSLLDADTNQGLELCSHSKVMLNNESFIESERLPLSVDELKMTLDNIIHNFNYDGDMDNSAFNYKVKAQRKKKLQKEMYENIKKLSLKLELLKNNNGISVSDSNYNNSEIELSQCRVGFHSTSEEEIKNKINVEFISTVNMSANSLSEIKSSEGVKTTVLDMEISKEIDRLKELVDGEEYYFVMERFLNKLNEMFSDSEKKVKYVNGQLIYTRTSDCKKLRLSHLSSGERQLIYIFLKVINSINKPSILLMDEPEISLHMSWQEKLIESIKFINPDCQIVIVTHSPGIVMNGWMGSYIDIDDISEGI